VLVALVTGALLASGAVEIYSSYNENQAALVTLQREKAAGAASRIETYVREIERQLVWTTQPLLVSASAALEQRRIDAVRLQRQVLAITEVSHIDASGREQLRVSRLAMDVVGSQIDYSGDPKFRVPKSGRTYFGPVYFRKESEPYMTIAMPQVGGGVTVAEVNLKFIWDVVSQIKVGKAGLAYTVDSGGALIAHPDISLVLQKTSLAELAQVKAALAPPESRQEVTIAKDLKGRDVLTAHSVIAPLGWVVIVEQPLGEALEPVRASATRTILLVGLGIALAVVASALLARHLARPIQLLQESAAKIGAGELDHQIAVGTNDELQALADEFNQMTARLRESYATLEQKVEDRTRELTESLEQQTATAQILGVISSSPTDLQPVMAALVESAARLCEAQNAQIFRVEGDAMRLVARYGPVRSTLEAGEARPLTRGSVSGRAILDRVTLHVLDLLAETEREYPDIAPAIQREGIRTTVGIPLLREGAPIGSITAFRTEVRPFTDKQIALLQTFADQAVIAIENVRLFKELEEKNRTITEALDQQTATAEILRAISGSPTDVQPVFDTIVRSATRLMDGHSATVALVVGDELHLAALTSVNEASDAETRATFPLPLGASGSGGHVIRTRRPYIVADVETDPVVSDRLRLTAPMRGFRSMLAVPMTRHDQAIGLISVTRRLPGAFSDDEVALLQTFADQAVIAVENVRLFQELQARTAELTRSVGELEALGEVGRAISSTLDLETVLATIVSRANDLAGTDGGALYEFDEATRTFRLRATHRFPDEFAAVLRATPLVYGEGAVGRTAMTREPIQVTDVMDVDAYTSRIRDALVTFGYRSLLAVPLVSEDEVVGALVVNRRAAGGFGDRTVELLRTFATQSALAIQNARLFQEIEDKSRQLEVANQHKSEFLASVSHELRTPLNAIIGFSEVMLERMFGDVNDKQEEYLNDILSSGRHLLSLINDILDLAKIEAGRMELEPTDFHLPQAIDNALVLIRERALRRGIALERWIDPRLGEIKGDERKIKQVLVNLLSNAVKFTPEGGRVDVRASMSNGLAEISVVDTGVGIAPEDQEAVFEEFRQVGTDYARKHEGTGLGLALARKFVELHGGKIWVSSQVGQGSTFTFTIPVTPWQAS
jgi:signal transduction histidine kinase/HAMP domain-containing protein